jgi:predicted membrane chloride channel (bestrophin family)
MSDNNSKNPQYVGRVLLFIFSVGVLCIGAALLNRAESVELVFGILSIVLGGFLAYAAIFKK